MISKTPTGKDPSIRVISTDFATLSSSLRCTCPKHDSRFFTRKVFIGFMCAFSRMITFLVWYCLICPCIHIRIFISVVFIWFCSHFLFVQHSPSYVTAGVIAVLYLLFLNSSRTFLSHMTPDISRDLFHPSLLIMCHIFLASSFCLYG